MSVRAWPVLPNLVFSDELRQALEAEREESGESMAEQIRGVLCAHYGIECEPVYYFGGKQPAGGKFTLRVSPEVFDALHRDKLASGKPMQKIVAAILAEHYE